jgi:predicted ribosome quality control (RQC) complex YloA/Tae2 family protein
MKLNTRLTYQELQILVSELKPIVINSFLKNIYHYNGLWLFKFSTISLVYEPITSIWIGEFTERETEIHSVCRKLRLSIGDRKVLDLFILKEDRTIVFKFRDYNLILENYAKGNVILTDLSLNIIVLTRIYGNISHNKSYVELIQNDTEIKLDYSILEESKKLYSQKMVKVQNIIEKKKKEKKTQIDHIKYQIQEFEKKIAKLEETIDEISTQETIDYEKLSKIHADRKKIVLKLSKAHTYNITKEKKIEKKQSEYLILNVNKWYQVYHWWETKHGFLVVGGKNAEQNEKLVKSYLNSNDYYFHSDLPGCGSFILFSKKDTTPDIIDLIDTANGVLSLSQQWKNGTGGNVYWVYGHQVSKTPPSGEYITKGSFMINGTRNYIKVDVLMLGYTLTKNNELVLAPYSVINRIAKKAIKLVPQPDTKKGNMKKLTSLIKSTFNIKDIPKEINLFNYPCRCSLNQS